MNVDSVARPYAFIKFDTFIQKTKKLYSDQRTQRTLEKLNEDLHDIQSIMTRNINDVLEQGERLDRVENMSGNLAMESKKYAKKAKDLSRQALIQKYMPVIVLVGLFICVYGFRRFFLLLLSSIRCYVARSYPFLQTKLVASVVDVGLTNLQH